ncbi:AraC family transcriptional regulator N-terminal domain-containing protein [Pseudomonas typographi]|uniref:AraC family transcriptional regulator N-terminal domain-containing protein n=1 Tax=Pseudomonas typographi TaxID=2715964 RepID=UPI00168324A7|nr:AraC family transcriptional regulator N-terminal domain-containing protein [Pseudomonas typographi]MBD1552329.1 hypothetical protein [Pseudomonas typographi]
MPDAAKESRRDTGPSSDAVNAELLDAWVRMLRLMRPHLIFLHWPPSIERKIRYRVLQGPMGWMDPDTTSERAEVIARDLGTPTEAFDWYSVGKAMGNVRNQGPQLILPVVE